MFKIRIKLNTKKLKRWWPAMGENCGKKNNDINNEEIIRNMEVKCPECGKIQNVSESVPDTVADTAEYSCISCEHEFLIGWYGVAEVR